MFQWEPAKPHMPLRTKGLISFLVLWALWDLWYCWLREVDWYQVSNWLASWR